MSEFNHLGKDSRMPTKDLDRFPAPKVDLVSFESSELTSHCPVTGQPDFYKINILYDPDKWCVESKSLKLYLMTFRDTEQFAEALCAEIADFLFEFLEPISVDVELTQQVRGGLVLRVDASRSKFGRGVGSWRPIAESEDTEAQI